MKKLTLYLLVRFLFLHLFPPPLLLLELHLPHCFLLHFSLHYVHIYISSSYTYFSSSTTYPPATTSLMPTPSTIATYTASVSTDSNFYCHIFVQDAGLLPVLEMSIHQPFTMFWPTDEALKSLPPERQHWLSSPEHQEQVAALVKAHIIRNSKVGRGGGRQ